MWRRVGVSMSTETWVVRPMGVRDRGTQQATRKTWRVRWYPSVFDELRTTSQRWMRLGVRMLKKPEIQREVIPSLRARCSRIVSECGSHWECGSWRVRATRAHLASTMPWRLGDWADSATGSSKVSWRCIRWRGCTGRGRSQVNWVADKYEWLVREDARF